VNINYKHHSWNRGLCHRTKRHIHKEELKNGNPIIVHELGKSQRYTKCSSPRFLSSFMMSLHCTSLTKLLIMYWSYIHTTGAVHKMEELAKIWKGVPTASTSCFWFRKLRDIVQALIWHPCTQNPQFGLVYCLSGAMESEPTDITTHRSLVEAHTIFHYWTLQTPRRTNVQGNCKFPSLVYRHQKDLNSKENISTITKIKTWPPRVDPAQCIVL
jgi:hypothetical protein